LQGMLRACQRADGGSRFHCRRIPSVTSLSAAISCQQRREWIGCVHCRRMPEAGELAAALGIRQLAHGSTFQATHRAAHAGTPTELLWEDTRLGSGCSWQAEVNRRLQ
jgi:hypothetical protein